MTMLRVGGLSDVLTPLPDCRQESTEKMERIISGVSNLCGMDFHNGNLCYGFLCARLISLYFSTLVLPLSCVCSVSLLRLPRQGLLRPIYIARAITSSPLHGYHAWTSITPVYLYPGYHATVRVPFLGYHTWAITLHHTRKSGYHTRLS